MTEKQAHVTRQGVHANLLRDVEDILEAQGHRRPERQLKNDRFDSALDRYTLDSDTAVRPPTWIVHKELTFGLTHAIFDVLADCDVQASIARSLRLIPPVLSSWFETYQRVQNICVHHGRLSNRGLGVYPALPKSRTIRWPTQPSSLTQDPWKQQRLVPVLFLANTSANHVTLIDMGHQIASMVRVEAQRAVTRSGRA